MNGKDKFKQYKNKVVDFFWDTVEVALGVFFFVYDLFGNSKE